MNNYSRGIYLFLFIFYVFFTIFSSINLIYFFNLQSEIKYKKNILSDLEKENNKLLSEINYLKNNSNLESNSKAIIFKKNNNEKFIFINNEKKYKEYINTEIKNRSIYILVYIFINIIIGFIIVYIKIIKILNINGKEVTAGYLIEKKTKYYKGI
ncbi:MAG: hypothetical protein N3A58_00935 [Spirochaetes bacterium]|nr:hypothetical protein [Spirochaetota bacterium]